MTAGTVWSARARSLALAVALTVPLVASAYTIRLSPTVVVIEAAPGAVETFTLRVHNGSEAPAPMLVYAWDYWYDGDERIYGPPGTTPRSAAGWVEIVPRQAIVPPGEWMEFLGTVSVPPDASGGYYATLFAATDFEQSSDPAVRAQTSARIGSVLLLDVSGTGERRIDVGQAVFLRGEPGEPGKVTIDVTNEGTVHVPLTLKGVVRSTDGEVLGTLATGTVKYALPGERVSIEAPWTADLTTGAYEFAGAVVYGDDLLAAVVQPLVVPEGPGDAAPTQP